MSTYFNWLLHLTFVNLFNKYIHLKRTITRFQLLFAIIICFLSFQVEGQLNADFLTIPSYNSSNNVTICQGSTVLFVIEDQNNTNITSTTTVSWAFTGATISSSSMRTPFAVTFNSCSVNHLLILFTSKGDCCK